MDELEQAALAGIKAHKTYSDGKVTLDADVFDDLLEAARRAALAARSEPDGWEPLRNWRDTDLEAARSEPGAEGHPVSEVMFTTVCGTCGRFVNSEDRDGNATAEEYRHGPSRDMLALAATPAADSRGLDVELLIDSIRTAGYDPLGMLTFEEWQDIAREYAALTDPDPAP